MPIMNGLELVKRLRKQHYRLYLAAVSAYADQGRIDEALAAGFDTYLIKPIEESQLREILQTSAAHRNKHRHEEGITFKLAAL